MTKYAAKGTLFQVEDASEPGTFLDVAHVRNIGGPAMSGDMVDVSAMDSTGFYREFVQGFNDGGEVTLELLFDPADPTQDNVGDEGLLLNFDTMVEHNYQIVFSDAAATIYRFAGLVSAFEPTAPHDEGLGLAVTIKVTGQPEFAAA